MSPRFPAALVVGLSVGLALDGLGAQQVVATAVAIESLVSAHAATKERITAAGSLEFADGGLCGYLGGAAVRLGNSAEAVVQVPLPQELAGQVPLTFTGVVEPTRPGVGDRAGCLAVVPGRGTPAAAGWASRGRSDGGWLRRGLDRAVNGSVARQSASPTCQANVVMPHFCRPGQCAAAVRG